MMARGNRSATTGSLLSRSVRGGFALALLLTAACGSTRTAPEDEASGSFGSGIDTEEGTLSADLDSTSGPGGGAPSQPGSSPGGESGTATQQPDAATPAAPSEGGGPQAAAGSPPPGVTADTITLGAYTIQGFSNFAAQFGINANTGNQEDQVNAVVGYINRNGGFAGRQARVVFHDYSIANASSTSAEAQAACTAFTEDSKVYAVATITNSDPNLFYACLAKRRTFAVSAGDFVDRQFMMQHASNIYLPAQINMTDIYRLNVQALRGQGFFGEAPKIGVMILDVPEEHRAVEQGLAPALEAAGFKLDAQAAITVGSADQEAQASNAVLRFKAEGITHVFFGRAPVGGFAQRAENQGYRPRYAVTSDQVPRALQVNGNPKQLEGAMGIGWTPLNDVGAADYPGPVSERETLCREIMNDAGIDTEDPTTAIVALRFCELFFFIRDALAETEGDLSLESFRAGAERLGTSFRSATTFASRFEPGLTHDGADSVRVNAFSTECRCFRYVSPVEKRTRL